MRFVIALAALALVSTSIALAEKPTKSQIDQKMKAAAAEIERISAESAAADFVGTWSVVVGESTGGTCAPEELSKAGPSTWTVEAAEGDPGSFIASVGGETSFPVLDGKIVGGGSRIEFVGYGAARSSLFGASSAATAWVSLTLEGAELVGTRRIMTAVERRDHKGKRVAAPCFRDFSVKGKRF